MEKFLTNTIDLSEAVSGLLEAKNHIPFIYGDVLKVVKGFTKDYPRPLKVDDLTPEEVLDIKTFDVYPYIACFVANYQEMEKKFDEMKSSSAYTCLQLLGKKEDLDKIRESIKYFYLILK